MNDLLVEAAVRAIEALTATATVRDERLDGEAGVVRQGLQALSAALADAGTDDAWPAFGRTRALQDEMAAGLDAAIGGFT